MRISTKWRRQNEEGDRKMNTLAIAAVWLIAAEAPRQSPQQIVQAFVEQNVQQLTRDYLDRKLREYRAVGDGANVPKPWLRAEAYVAHSDAQFRSFVYSMATRPIKQPWAWRGATDAGRNAGVIAPGQWQPLCRPWDLAFACDVAVNLSSSLDLAIGRGPAEQLRWHAIAVIGPDNTVVELAPEEICQTVGKPRDTRAPGIDEIRRAEASRGGSPSAQTGPAKSDGGGSEATISSDPRPAKSDYQSQLEARRRLAKQRRQAYVQNRPEGYRYRGPAYDLDTIARAQSQFYRASTYRAAAYYGLRPQSCTGGRYHY